MAWSDYSHSDCIAVLNAFKVQNPRLLITSTFQVQEVISRVFIRSRQPANSGSYFQYQRRLLLLTFAIRTLKVYFFVWRLLTLHWSYKNKGTRKWKFVTLILGLIFCCGWFQVRSFQCISTLIDTLAFAVRQVDYRGEKDWWQICLDYTLFSLLVFHML